MIYLLIPAFNESRNFEHLLQNIDSRLKKVKYKVIVVDDGSTDSTKDKLKRLSQRFPVIRIGYLKNRGPGGAFRFGFDFLFKVLKASDLVVTMEADNTGDYSVLHRMLKLTLKYDVVLASPYASGGKFEGVGFIRLSLSYAANLIDRIVFRVNGVKTYSSFYRVYKGSILKRVLGEYGRNYLNERGFAVFVELIVKLSFINAKIIEVPAKVDWRKRIGKSKNNLFKAVLFHFLLYFKYFKGEFGIQE